VTFAGGAARRQFDHNAKCKKYSVLLGTQTHTITIAIVIVKQFVT